jgi:hypothetical protein
MPTPITPLSQRDPRWAETKLGTTVYTVARYGCTVTSLSMASEFFSQLGAVPPKPPVKYVLPGDMAKTLEFTPEGFLLWGTLSKVGMKLVERVKVRDDAKIKAVLDNAKQACLLQVEGWHWVLALGIETNPPKPATGSGSALPASAPGIVYRILDPWLGDKALSTRYKSITGHATVGVA